MNQDQLQKLLEEIVKLPSETEWVEFKASYFDAKNIGEKIAGLANSACLFDKSFAYLIFGINDGDHAVLGTKFDFKKEKIGNEDVENWIIQRLNPKLDFRVYDFIYEDKKIILFEIPAAIDRPVAFTNKEYVRIGSINRELKEFPDKERKIWNNFKNKNFEKEIAKQNVSDDEVLNLLDYSKYFSLTQQSLPSDKAGFLDRMAQDKLINRKTENTFDITNLGAILFAKNIKEFDTVKRKSIRVIIYKNKDRIQIIKEQDGTLGYAVGFTGLVEYINDKLPSNEEIKKALRVEKKMYPEVAIRELVANALIHQDFKEKGAGPMIEIFSDRIEITNPGKPLISTDRFIDHPPQSRNEDLAAFMRRVKICEEGGTGIDRVISLIELFQLPAPKFESLENFTRITIYSHKKLNAMDREDKIRACYQHCVLKYLSNEKMTNSSLRERFGIGEKNYPAASKIIRDTLNEELIKESNKTKEYIPIWA
ncbi:MAG: transcriptional regulator [Candidatus Moranbacteria bacterium CG23_combo_of_CG06-09_8_20_14_all_39_10]|nr:MAG: transcriptional regulator [Candidatus Moranbacteria bacterium CG23_combo_of_CG06-09_8_20_14_all_39_10]